MQYDFMPFVSLAPSVNLVSPRFAEGTGLWMAWCRVLDEAASRLSHTLPPLQLAQQIAIVNRMLAEVRGGTMDHLIESKGRVMPSDLEETEASGSDGQVVDAPPGEVTKLAERGAPASTARDAKRAGVERWLPPGVVLPRGSSVDGHIDAKTIDAKARLAAEAWVRLQLPVLAAQEKSAGPLFFTTSMTPWNVSEAEPASGPATGAGVGGIPETSDRCFVEPWGSELEPAGTYHERLSNLYDYDLSHDASAASSEGPLSVD